MSSNYNLFIDTVLVIKENPELKDCFKSILKIGGLSQQVRVSKLLHELEKLNAPENIKNFVKLLADEKLAQQVLIELSRS